MLIGLTFATLLGTGVGRLSSLKPGATQPGGAFGSLLELPLLFYVLIALALPIRHADLVIVALSWVFVVTCFAHVGIFVTSGNGQQRSPAWFAGVLVLFAMWLYFAIRILLLI